MGDEKLKKLFKRCLFVLCFAMLVIIKSTTVLAEITEQDNLKVKLQLEQVESNAKEVKGTVNVTNVGIRAIDDINVECIIPEGMKIKKENNLTKEIGTLEAGESATFEFYCEVVSDTNEENGTPSVDVNVGFGKPSDNDTSDTNEGSGIPSVDVNVGLAKPSDNDTNDKDSGILNNVVTGNISAILALSLAIILCGGGTILLLRSKGKNAKRILSIFLCLSLIATMIESLTVVQAYEREKKEISIKEEITIGENLYTVEAVVSYKLQPTVIEPSGNTITRGQWISKLVETMELKGNQELEGEDFEYPFDDIEGHEYEEDIIYANVYGILDVEEGAFNPNDLATREFAALTAVKALKFNLVQDIICDDSNEITYLKEIEVAVAMNIMNLEDNKFYPLRALTETEAEYVLEGVRGILNSSNIDSEYDNTFEYKEGIIELADNISYEVNGSTLTFEANNEIKNLKKDDIFVLPTQRPYKVVEVKVEGNNVIVETVDPTIEETLEYLDIQGEASVDIGGFIPAEGIEIIEDNEPEARDINIDKEDEINFPGTINLKIKKKLSDELSINGNFSLAIPKISYKADVNVGLFNVDVNNAYLKFLADIKLTGSLVLSDEDFNGKCDGFIELGKIPVVGIPGVAIYVELGAYYSVQGKVSIVYSFNGNLGVQVLNNRLRAIYTSNSELNFGEVQYTVKVGPKLKGLLEICALWDLIDFSASLGAATDAVVSIRDTGMECLDITAFMYFDLTALDECKIREWLNLTYTWNLCNKKNSPIKKNWHLEDLHKVPQCTYGSGTIKGTVAEAGNREKFIKNALIQVYDASNNKLIEETNSDTNGQYSVKLKAGTYRLKISRAGYISFESVEVLRSGEEKYVETYLMVGQGTDGEEGIAGGKIINALTGGNVPDILMNIRNGWNNVTGDIIKTVSTNEDGIYEVKLPLGNYTVEMIKEGYVTKSYNIYVASGSALNQNNSLVPESSEMPAGDLRIVLTWGENPRDLDSHLVGPNADGSDYFHIYYRNKSYSENGIMYADLDLDDVDSYGPETTTVYNMNSEGKYSFYVHDYTNRYENLSTAMSNSGAKVEVYKGDTLYVTYNIPANNVGTYWHVFDYDADENMIVPVNKFVDEIGYRGIKSYRAIIPTWYIEEKVAS